MRTPPRPSPRRGSSLAFALLGSLWLASAIHAAPVAGFVEHFPGTSIRGWDGGAIENSPGTGGVAGAGDSCLRISTPNGLQHNLGVRSTGLEYLGDRLAAGGPPSPRALHLAGPAPNLSPGDVTLALQLFESGPVRIEILDAASRLVRRALLASEGPGSRAWTWDGRDGGGRAAPAGHYRVRATGPSGGMSRALVRVD
jgi:hypothetical protein